MYETKRAPDVSIRPLAKWLVSFRKQIASTARVLVNFVAGRGAVFSSEVQPNRSTDRPWREALAAHSGRASSLS